MDFSVFQPTMEFLPLYRFSSGITLTAIGFDNFHVIKPQMKFHSQVFYTLHIVLDGEGVLETDGKRYEVRTGDTFFLPPNALFRYFPKKENPYYYLWFRFSGAQVKEYFQQLLYDEKSPCYHVREFSELKEKIYEFLSAHQSRCPLDEEMLSLAYLALSILRKDRVPHSDDKNGTLPFGIKKMKQMIEVHYTKCDFTVEELAKLCHVSHSHLCHLFQKQANVSPKEYLQQVRMSAACELLENSNLSIGEVAYSCGYSDPLYFSTLFKRRFTVTPTQYRARQGERK